MVQDFLHPPYVFMAYILLRPVREAYEEIWGFPKLGVPFWGLAIQDGL